MSSYQEYDISHIATAQNLMIKADHAIKIAIDSTATAWEASAIMLAGGSFTHVYFKNENTTNTCSVDAIVTD